MVDQLDIDHSLPEKEQKEIVGRRALLKAIAATGGAITASSLVPGQWVKPVVAVGWLPAQAQISPTPTPLVTPSPLAPEGSFIVTAIWNDPNDGDVDLVVQEPTGEFVHPLWGIDPGPTADHSDNNLGSRGLESVNVPANGAASGVYRLYLMNNKASAVIVNGFN